MTKMLTRRASTTPTLLFLFGFTILQAAAQDYVTADPRHYKVELENSEMRVVRCKYGSREKSGMLKQPDRLAVFLTDFHVRITLPDGSSREVQAHARRNKVGAGGNPYG